jgi:hypothetical protein
MKIALTPRPLPERREGNKTQKILVPLALWERG